MAWSVIHLEISVFFGFIFLVSTSLQSANFLMIVMEPRYQFRFCCFCFSRYTRSDVLYSNLEIFIHTSSTHSIDDFPFNLFFQPVHWRKISHDRGSKARN